MGIVKDNGNIANLNLKSDYTLKYTPQKGVEIIVIKLRVRWTMNLVTEGWVPVVRMDGKPDFASLMQIFAEGDKFSDLSVRRMNG